MVGRAVLRTGTVVFCTVLVAFVHAHPPNEGMGGMMGGGSSSGMMGGPMMDMMMGGGSGRGMGMGMMGGSGMLDCPGMGGSMMGRSMMGDGIERFLQIPDLSSDQRQKLIDRHRQLQRQLLQLQGKGLDAQFALQDAASADTPDPKAVGRALQNVYAIRTQMVEAAIAAANDARGELTEQQRQTLTNRGMGMSGMRGSMMSRP